jgi:Xaa-Pro aminopeptidase
LGRKGIGVSALFDLPGEIWQDRPSLPADPLFEMPVEYSGKSTPEKLAEIYGKLREDEADCLLMTSLDEIAWTFNIRGTDVTYNPVVISYAFVSEKESVLFIDPRKLTEESARRLKNDGVKLADYSKIYDYLSTVPENSSVFIDPAKTNVALCEALPPTVIYVKGISPANHLKSIKNETEIKGFRSAVVKDGVALTRFYFWLEKQLAAGERVTEISACAKLTALRA